MLYDGKLSYCHRGVINLTHFGTSEVDGRGALRLSERPSGLPALRQCIRSERSLH